MEPAPARRRGPPSRGARWCRRAGLGLATYLVAGNALLLGTSVALQVFGPDGDRPAGAAGIDHLRVVDERLWRGGAPSAAGYDWLAERGVTTIVDLRAAASDEELAAPERLGFDVVHLPVEDGQTPSDELVHELISVVEGSDGVVFVHCQAGVGRTGSVAAAYQVWTGENGGSGALVDNLAIGPPTLEQVAFTLGLEAGEADEPSLPVVVASRVLDSPRQLWNSIFG